MLCPDSTSHEEKGLVTIKHFLGCAESVILILNKEMIIPLWHSAISLASVNARMMFHYFIALFHLQVVDMRLIINWVYQNQKIETGN